MIFFFLHEISLSILRHPINPCVRLSEFGASNSCRRVRSGQQVRKWGYYIHPPPPPDLYPSPLPHPLTLLLPLPARISSLCLFATCFTDKTLRAVSAFSTPTLALPPPPPPLLTPSPFPYCPLLPLLPPSPLLLHAPPHPFYSKSPLALNFSPRHFHPIYIFTYVCVKIVEILACEERK